MVGDLNILNSNGGNLVIENRSSTNTHLINITGYDWAYSNTT
jgi:hypothetical protein